MADATDPALFVPPIPLPHPRIAIEFCDRCRWLHRATWTSTELFLTFPPPAITAISIVPLNSEDTAGRFRVWLETGEDPPILMWDRKVEGGFPELKVLVKQVDVPHDVVFTLAQKQRIRDRIQPDKSLGHSDRKS